MRAFSAKLRIAVSRHASHGFQHGMVHAVGIDQKCDAGGVGLPLPADLLVQPVLQGQAAVLHRNRGQPSRASDSPSRVPGTIVVMR